MGVDLAELAVCLDPGHQAVPDLSPEPVAPGSAVMKARCATGTRGLRTGVPEHEVALAVALFAEEAFTKTGVRVVLTRCTAEMRLSNTERAEIANNSGCLYFIRIHCNGVRPSLRWLAGLRSGCATLVPKPRGDTARIYMPSRILGAALQHELVRMSTFRDRGVIERSDLTAFNWSRLPVTLVELGYLTHPREEAYLIDRNFQRRMAEAIVTGTWKAHHDIKLLP